MIFTPLSSLYALKVYFANGDQVGYPCPGGSCFDFISADNADTFPCGFRGEENLGNFWNVDVISRSRDKKEYRLCEWECFRDPADLIGPLMDFRINPFSLIKKYRKHTEFYYHWLTDIRYQ